MSTAVGAQHTGIWSRMVGQHEAVRILVAAAGEPGHAYLFVGPEGSGKAVAARAFAALLLDPTGDPDSRDSHLALAGEHPDVIEVRREGAAISKDQADEIIKVAMRSPTESNRKVLILHDFHLLSAEAAARLLKVVEEPPASTIFVILSDQSPPELVTIASRCMKITFHALTEGQIADTLVAEGVDTAKAALCSLLARGSIDRARLLANDEQVSARHAAFASVPHRLDGTGAVVTQLTAELLGLIEEAMAPLYARHAAELAELEERIKRFGERGSGRKAMEDRHKREIRRYRTDELRSGLAVVAGVYRDLLVEHGDTRRPDAFVKAVARIHDAMTSLERNAKEDLLLYALFLDLPSF